MPPLKTCANISPSREALAGQDAVREEEELETEDRARRLFRNVLDGHPEVHRPFWTAKVTQAPPDGVADPATATKTGGDRPYVTAKHPWPMAGGGERQLTFLTQVRSSH